MNCSKKYADFIVRVGVNPQPGQTMIIRCPLEAAPLARLCVRSGFEAGARDVQVDWSDNAVSRTRMELGSEEALTDSKPYQLRRYLDYAESEGSVCVLHLIADDPEVYAGLDGAKISRVNAANRKFMAPWREYTMNDRVQWSIAAMPSAPWAKKMFPELDTDAAIEKLWQLIFDVCRVTGGDPVNEWKAHLDRLTSLGEKMNDLDLESVHFESANGTDLTVGLAEKASWESAEQQEREGRVLPAQHPHRGSVHCSPTRIRWTASSTAPSPMCSMASSSRDSMLPSRMARSLSMEPRRVLTCWVGCWIPTKVPAISVRWHWCLHPAPSTAAARCSTALCSMRTLPATLPLVPAIPAPPRGGTGLTKEQLEERGMNQSTIHEDVMIGAEDSHITGKCRDGRVVELFRNGVWVL